MKKALLTISTGLMLTGMFLNTQAQTAQNTATKSVAENKNEGYIKKANTITERIATTVNITEAQKVKLQASLLTCFKNFDSARIAVKGDDSRLQNLKSELQENLIASVKSVLSPEQFNRVMEQQQNSK